VKKVFYLLLIVVVLGFTYSNLEKYKSLLASLHPCKQPITYRVDTVDPKFNLTQKKFTDTVAEAAKIWNSQYGKNLFVYDTNGKLSINLIFDERQAASNRINQLENELEGEKGKLDEQIKSYRAQVAEFKNRLAAHNTTVESWNRQGGAPEEEFNKLNAEQKDLQAEADKLNGVAAKLNLTSENYNLGVGKLNSAIGDFNEDLEKKPEEGLYIGESNRIEIYFNNNRQELVHTIAHEFGHAIGMDHVANARAIMYPFSTKTVSLTSDDVSELEQVCREKSVIEAINSRLNL